MNMQYEELVLKSAHMLVFELDWWLFGLAYLMKHCWVMYWQVGSDNNEFILVGFGIDQV